MLNAGRVIILQNDVPASPRDPANFHFDGRDKFGSTLLVAVTQTGWPLPSAGSLLADATEVFSTNDWGTTYEAPGGEGYSAMFEDARFIVMAQRAGTIIRVDLDSDGTDDLVQPLGEGETLVVDGVLVGTKVYSNLPVQTTFLTGDIGANYENRWYSMVPRNRWSSSYIAPVSTTISSNPTSVLLYNPHTTILSVDVTTTTGTTTVNVPAGGLFRYFMPVGSGARFQSTDGRPFFAIANSDDEGSAFDWGHTLLPASTLAPAVKAGWAPGSANPAAENSSPIWVTAASPTTLNIDWNDDGAVDQTVAITQALQSVQLRDASDNDQTGARIFTTDGTLIAAAWGQDPNGASPALPALDVGTAVLPAPDVSILKNSTLAQDQNGNGLLDPGDTLLYTLFVLNTGVVDADNVQVRDTPDPYTTYAPDTTAVDGAPYPDDSSPSTPFPLDEAGIDLGTLTPGQGVTITYELAVGDPLPSPQQQIVNTAEVTYGTGVFVSSTHIDSVTTPQFGITKASNLTGPALPGQIVQYSVVIQNTSPFLHTGISVTDAVPAGTSYVADSTSATSTVQETFRDDFNAVAYDNNDGTQNWSTNWLEMNDDNIINNGDVRVTTDRGATRLLVRDNNRGVQRGADLSGLTSATLSFSYRRNSLDSGNEWVAVWASSNGGASWTELPGGRFAGPATDAGYTTVSFDISTFISANTRIRFYAAAPSGSNDDQVFFDDVRITATAAVTKTNQAAAANPLLDGNPPDLVVPGDGFSLAPGQSMTVTYSVVVDDPLVPYLPVILNAVSVDSNESLTSTPATRLDPVAPGSILGDRVWLDGDGDGVQDIGEVGLSNVRVSLFQDPDGIPGNGDEVVAATAFTDSSGNYLFNRVYPPAAGRYYVEVDAATLPAGLAASPGNNGGRSASVAITGNDTLVDLDFGYTAPPGTAVAGDRVWSDADDDGIQDPGEVGIGGVTLDLVAPGPDGQFGTGDDLVTAAATTASDGTYLFVGVAPGLYRIDVTDTGSVLAGYTHTSGPQSNPDPTTSINLAADEIDVSRDFGYRNPSLFSVADAVWDDGDGDGIRDPGETGISGVTVALRDGGGNLIGTAVSDGAGAFSFSGLANGNYTVVLTDTSGVLVNLQATTAPANAGRLAVPVAGADVAGWSFGYRTLGSIGEVVWSDANGDGVRDASEPGIAGVSVRLVLSGLDGLFGTVDDQVYATTATAADGSYRFNGLSKTYYRVEVTDTGGVLTGSVQTGDPDTVLDGMGDVPLQAGAVDLTMNFGYQDASLADLSGSVFDDVDLDGVGDPGENGIAGVSLDLVAAGADGVYGTIDDLVLATTSTDASGDYVFVDVPDGDYQVRVTDTGNVLNGYALTSGLDTIGVTVTGVDVTGIDFGYAHDFGTASIGTRVWLDANRDGVSNPSEDGLANVTVNLYTPGPDGILGNGDDVLVGTTTTDSNGYYGFSNLPAGDYYVDVDQTSLPPDLGPTVGTSDPTGRIQLADGQVYGGANFGYASATGSALGDSVFFDANGDGFQNPGEPGIGGVGLTVTGPSGSFNLVADADGSWLVAGLAPGSYTVTVDTGTLPPGYNTMPTNGPASRNFPVAAGFDYLRADFGFDAPAGVTGSIGDNVFFDANGNGALDGGEGGISGVTLRLLDGSGSAVATTTTDVNGTYSFVGLPAGNYQVEVTDRFGALAGLNLSAGSSPTGTIALAASDNQTDVDFGYTSSGGTGAIGGFVWHDSDGSGAVNGSEAGLGIQAVTADLYLDVNGNGALDAGIDNLVRTTQTNIVGGYQFNGVPPGGYLVVVTDTAGVLTGFSKTSGAVGVDDNSQPIPYLVNLAAGSSNFTADFGYLAAGTSSISGTTFFDVTGDGLMNGTDSGIDSVEVALYRDLDGDGVLDTTDPRIGILDSDSNGNFVFANMPDGNFVVAVDVTGTFLASSYQTTQLATAGVQPVSLAGADSSANDFGFNVSATLVTITRFDAHLQSGEVVVEWVTGSEVGTLGFYLFRWDEASRRYLQVNDAILPGLMAPQGGRYRLIDEEAPQTGTVAYLLHESEESGGVRRYGPYFVHPANERPGVEPMAGRFERRARRQSRAMVERAERGRARRSVLGDSQASRRSAGPRLNRNDAALKLTVGREGVYFVGADRIAAELSLPEAEVKNLLARRALSLTNQGQKVAGLASADGRGLYFYGLGMETMYGQENAYWLQLGAGVSMGSVDGTPFADEPGFYLHREHLEKDVFAATLASKDPDSDFWYWSSLMASYPEYAVGTYRFDASAIAAAEVPVEVDLHVYGATTTAHRLRVRMNGVLVGEGTFDGVGASVVRVELDPSLLLEGTNAIEVEAIREPEAAFDVVYVDSLDVSYPRRHLAAGNALSFRAAEDGAVRVDGLPGVDTAVLDVTEPRMPSLVSQVEIQAGTARFETVSGRSYFVFSPASVVVPEIEPVETRRSLRRGGADYVVIAPESLAEAAQELADYRASQGLSSRVVTLETIHDELGFGIPSPDNVTRFVRLALASWRPAPRFVVLLGKGTYDFKDTLGNGDNLMPPLMAATPLGLYASDNRIADVSGDGLPDVMIGRIPVLSDEEVLSFLAKLRAFEGSGLSQALFVADNPDVAGNFTGDSNDIISLLPETVEAHRVYLSALSIDEARQKLFETLATGVGYWNYVGHGGLDRFADEGLLVAADVPALANQATPVLASLTCNVGRFEIPGWSSLAEALVTKGDGGAIAAWSPSGLSYNSQALILNRALVRSLYDEKTRFLGEAIGDALRNFSEKGQLRFMLSIYNLLGDPATRLR